MKIHPNIKLKIGDKYEIQTDFNKNSKIMKILDIVDIEWWAEPKTSVKYEFSLNGIPEYLNQSWINIMGYDDFLKMIRRYKYNKI